MDDRDGVATVPGLARGAARAFAGREFVVTPDRSLTFDEADARSRHWAKRLLASGIGKGSRVGLLFSDRAEFVVAFLAITRVGAIAVPMSTFAKPPELRRALGHADVGVLLTPRTVGGSSTEELLEAVFPQLAETGTPRLLLDDAPFLRSIWILRDGVGGGDGAEPWPDGRDGRDGEAESTRGGGERAWATDVPGLWDLEDGPNFEDQDVDDDLLARAEAEVTPADPVVIVSTSGATAEPKAVVHTHGTQIRHGRAMAEVYELTPDDRTFTNMPFFWVGGLTVVVLSALHVGAAVVTVERMDTTEMLDLIERARPTRLLGWTLYERLSADPTFGSRDLSSVVEMRPPERAAPGLRHNSLGMTETGGPHTAASRTNNAVDLPEHLRGSFGPPVPGTQHKIVDPESGEELAEGDEGEICVRGGGLMDGLYKKERRQVFDEDGWYHTGDKGFLRDGFLFFTGRLTEMIKTGGANVAPREVELAIEAHPGVQAAFVVGLPDEERGELVGCIVCPVPGHELDPAELRDQLRDEPASYKIPRKMMVVAYDDMPWLPTGKMSTPRIVELLSESG